MDILRRNVKCLSNVARMINNNALLTVNDMSKTTDTLAAYLADTNDSKGVVSFIRQQWPKSLSSYVSQVKKQWMTLDLFVKAQSSRPRTASSGQSSISAGSKPSMLVSATVLRPEVSHSKACGASF